VSLGYRIVLVFGLVVAIALGVGAFWHGRSQINKANYTLINLANYTLTFSDEFTSTLDVSADGPGTKWIYNKPDGGNFGQVGWGDVFSTSDGILTISLHSVSGVWHGGLLASIARDGTGFAQQYGYFEMRAKLPAGLGGNWPAFWLLAQNHIVTPAIPDVEIDVVGQFGNFKPQQLNFVYHHWTTPHVAHQFSRVVGDMSSDFHTYGVSIDVDWIIWYFDWSEIGRLPTPPEAKTPMYVLVDLACSGSPPCGDPNTIDPSHMYVDYVRVYRQTEISN
jgi:beta-glucanase (GH16 family)